MRIVAFEVKDKRISATDTALWEATILFHTETGTHIIDCKSPVRNGTKGLLEKALTFVRKMPEIRMGIAEVEVDLPLQQLLDGENLPIT